MMSDSGQYALRDMVELQMYLMVQPQQKPCPLLPRRTKTLLTDRKPHCNPIESSSVAELMDGGFIERSSSRTYVVSKTGYDFYESQLKTVHPAA
jgi:hypothetical protein